jgi:hypothetical protein
LSELKKSELLLKSEEIKLLILELDFLERIPNIFYFGFLEFSVTTVKDLLLENCKYQIMNLKAQITRQFENIVAKTQNTVTTMLEKLDTRPRDIEHFFQIREFLNGADLKDKINSIDENLIELNSLVDVIEKFNIDYDPMVYEDYFRGNFK